MTAFQLDIAPRTRGRAQQALSVEYARDLTQADIVLLSVERGTRPPAIKELRERHHAAARLLAQGRRPSEVAALTGYGVSRISILQADPTFSELVENYRSIQDHAQAEFVDRATTLAISAMGVLQDAMETEEPPSIAQTLEVAKFASDRIGHAPVTRVQNTNINVDLGARMEAARKRLAAAPHIVSVTNLPRDEDD